VRGGDGGTPAKRGGGAYAWHRPPVPSGCSSSRDTGGRHHPRAAPPQRAGGRERALHELHRQLGLLLHESRRLVRCTRYWGSLSALSRKSGDVLFEACCGILPAHPSLQLPDGPLSLSVASCEPTDASGN
jgi:hypothetical protein